MRVIGHSEMRNLTQCQMELTAFYLFLRGGLRAAMRPSIICGPMRNPDHNQRLDKSISRSYELERMHNLHRIQETHQEMR